MALDQNIANLFGNVFKNDVKISKLCADIRGKVILIYGGNNLGKSKQASQFPNPVFMPFENGLSAINGALVLKNKNWVDFKRNVKKLTTDKRLLKVLQDQPITIVMDNIAKSGTACQKFLEEKYKLQDISEGKSGRGLWSYYEKEYWNTIAQLFNLGYTVVGITHAGVDNDTKQIKPDGDKRSVGAFRDNADFTVYLESNGVDKEGNVIPSSAFLAETEEYFARTRFDCVDTYLEEFSAENLINAIVDGIKEQIEKEGAEEVSFDEQSEIYKGDDYSHDELVEAIKVLFTKMEELDALDDYDDIVSEFLDDIPVSEATDKQIQPLIAIKEALEEKIEELEEE